MFASNDAPRQSGPLECRPMRLRSSALSLFALSPLCGARSSGPGVLYEGDSPFNHLIVAQDAQGIRRLYFEKDGAVQSAIKPGAGAGARVALRPRGDALAGGAPSPREGADHRPGRRGDADVSLRALYPDAQIEVVDIDPDVVKVATKSSASRRTRT